MISKQYRIVTFCPTETEREKDRRWIMFANPLKLNSAGFVSIYENKCLETEIFIFPYESPTCLWLRANAEYGNFFWAPVIKDYELQKTLLNGKGILAYYHKEFFDQCPDSEEDENGDEEDADPFWPEYRPDQWCYEYCTQTLIPDLHGKRNEIWRDYQEYMLKHYRDNPLSIRDFIMDKYYNDPKFAEWLFGNKDLAGRLLKDLCFAYKDEWDLLLCTFDL